MLEAFILAATLERVDDVSCAERVVYHEARGETFLGQLAVAWVVVNRSTDPVFPDSVCEVAAQPGQFHRGHTPRDQQALLLGRLAASMAIFGVLPDPTGGATYFIAPRKLGDWPAWTNDLQTTAQIGSHVFMRATD